MRISTSQIFDNGALGIQRNQQGLFKLQNQLSTGRRVLSRRMIRWPQLRRCW